MEGETQQSLQPVLVTLQERALPDLGDNIKCGNSLIGPDFYQQQLLPLDEEEQYRVNVFDWKKEFGEIFKLGGFDAVIGNPPYIRIGNIEEIVRPYLYGKYDVNHRFDIYVVFVERGMELLSSDGLLGFILPNKFLTTEYGESMRKNLADTKAVRAIVDFGDSQVFHGASTYTCLLFLARFASKQIDYTVAKAEQEAENFVPLRSIAVQATTLSSEPWNFLDDSTEKIIKKVSNWPKLGSCAEIQRGLETGFDEFYLLANVRIVQGKNVAYAESEAEPHGFKIETSVLRPVTKGSVDIFRYYLPSPTRYVFFPYVNEGEEPELISDSALRKSFPLAWEYLSRHSQDLKDRKGPKWYAFRRRNYDLRQGITRILVPSIGKRACFALDEEGSFHFLGSGGGGGGGYGLVPKLESSINIKFLLGILNSKFADWFIKLSNSKFSGGYYSFNKQYIEALPIRVINTSDRVEKSGHEKIVNLVNQALELHKNLAAAKTPQEKTSLERQIAATDAQIDRLVYDLYGLTPEEIKIVETSTPAQ